MCFVFSQGLLSGANQLQDLTNDPDYSDLVGLTWDQIQAAFPTRLQQLANKTYEEVQRSKADDDVMEAFGVTEKTQAVASMSPEERLQRLHLIMNDRYAHAEQILKRFSIGITCFHAFPASNSEGKLCSFVFPSPPSNLLQLQWLSVFAQVACHVLVFFVRGGADPESA
jgi:hypothetical protein